MIPLMSRRRETIIISAIKVKSSKPELFYDNCCFSLETAIRVIFNMKYVDHI